MIETVVMTPSSDDANEAVQPEDIEQLRQRVEMLESRVYVAKVAYLNRTPLEGKEVSYEALSAIAKQYIQASYALQKAKFGSVKVKMSVAKLLR